MNPLSVIFYSALYLAFCWLVYRLGYGWRTPSAYAPSRVMERDLGGIDLRPGGITVYNCGDQCSTMLLLNRTETLVGSGFQPLIIAPTRR
jgi:hypothetical protein